MKIWVDADACPAVIRDILFRAAARTAIPVVLIANRKLNVPRSPHIQSLQVAGDFDAADKEIVKQMTAGDLVITADIPLAAEVIARGGQALNPRGELYTQDSVRERLIVRDFMDTLRSSGIQTGGPPALNQADRKLFADNLDRLLARRRQEDPASGGSRPA